MMNTTRCKNTNSLVRIIRIIKINFIHSKILEMKTFLILSLSLLAFANKAFSQGMCSNNNKVVSPVVPKPTEGAVVSATCFTLVVQWKSSSDKSYEVIGSYLDPATNQKTETTPVTNSYCDDDANCSATIPVVAGTIVNWTVQAVDVIKGRTFYSYPFRSAEGYLIPTCESSNIVRSTARKDKAVASKIADKMKGELYPNPVQSILNIKFNSNSNKNQIKVFDVNGRIVITKQATPGVMQLNVNHLRSGLYIIRIENSNGKPLYTARFIKG